MIRALIDSLKKASAFTLIISMTLLVPLTAIGWFYWVWIAVQFGNFWMFFFACIPPTMLVAVFVGAYSIIFGIPLWVYTSFG